MRRRTLTIAAPLLPLAAVGSSLASAARSPSTAAGHARGFERFLATYEAANSAFVSGDPSLWLSITAGADPVSIFGGFGGLGDAGVEAVHQRYLLAAGAFQPGGTPVEFDYLVKDVRGALAYTVAIERSLVMYTGQSELRAQVLRVTMIFRCENRSWRIVHRHADTMVDLELPTR